MSLKTRFLVIAATLILLASASVWLAFERIAENIIAQWGQRVVEVQVRYDSARLLQPLEREVALSRQLADSNVLKRWATSPDADELEEAAVAEMESFRRNFRDGNYFVALKDSGAYYYNNAANEYAGKELRYYLDPDKPDDAWFFTLIEQGRDFHLNVNPDTQLGETKLWVDVLMRDDERILGIVGTGLDLSSFLQEVVDLGQPGITTLFVDLNGAIQLYRDESKIDYASLVKPEGQKNTLDMLLDSDEEYAWLESVMGALAMTPALSAVSEVHTGFVSVEGKRRLLGIAFLPSIGWYEVTLLDLDAVMPVSRFWVVALVFGLTLLVALALFHLAVSRLILRPIAALEEAMTAVAAGKPREGLTLPAGQGEIGRLIRHFGDMAEAIGRHTEELESKVRARTEALHSLARVDPLTGLCNRRGMQEVLNKTAERARREGTDWGLLWLDVDRFKDINDRHGHAVGDAVLKVIAEVLRESLRPYDAASRWGGDEFLVLLAPCEARTLTHIGERIRSALAARAPEGLEAGVIRVSIGASLAAGETEVEKVLNRADDALYKVKQSGRDGLCLWSDDAPG